MKLGKIIADLHTENIRSVKLLEKNGFQRSKTYTISNENGDNVEMAIYFLERTDIV